MKILKLDRRYAGFPKWKYALHFGTRYSDQRKQQHNYVKVFRKLYGDDCWLNPDRKIFGPEPMWLYSKDWKEDLKRGRIYFNNESDISIVELML